MMENFTFHNPTKVIFGRDTVRQIGGEISARGYKKVLLVAGGGSIKKNGVYDAVVGSLRAGGVAWEELWGVRANPELATVRKGIDTARREEVDAVLAVGGGSVIDSTKAIAVGVYVEDIWAVYEGKAKAEKALPIFTVLTLSATGTEMNGNSVLTHDEEKKKWDMHGAVLYPVVTIIDPTVQMSLPWSQTVNGGLDAMAHLMEYYFLGSTEEVTIAVDEALMRTAIKAVDALQKDPSDYDARANLAWTATLALNDVSGVAMKGGDWATHYIQHSLSALHPDVAHGEGLGVLFPAWITYVQDRNPAQFERWAREVWQASSVDEALGKWKATLKRWGAPTTLRELGFSEDEIKPLAENCMMHGQPGQLRKLDRQDVEAILRMAF